MKYHAHADLGGTGQPGAIANEPEDERFHADWERQALALTLAMGATGAWNIDMSRAARETLPDYAERSYYSIWLAGLERLLMERGLVTPQELAAGHAQQPGPTLPRRLAAKDVPAVLQRGSPTERPATAPARFGAGDAVITHRGRPPHHTRLPAYAMGRRGVIERVHGVHVFADAHAQGLGEQPQWLYGVRFEAHELWAEATAGGAHSGATVSVDIWESLLEPSP